MRRTRRRLLATSLQGLARFAAHVLHQIRTVRGDDLNLEHDSDAALLTHPDAAEWVNRAIDTAGSR